MDTFDTNSYTDAEITAEFDYLFPHGFAGPDVLREIAPDGWEKSPLLAVYYPSANQQYKESLQLHRSTLALRRPGDTRPLPPEPKREEFTDSVPGNDIDVEREVRELVGQCVWDLFSDNHEVIGPDGRVLDMGSFRASGGFIADLVNGQIGGRQYDYMSFYLGTIWVSQRADLSPVYEMIFRRLRRRELDWAYHFPRLYAIDFRPLKQALEKKSEPEWANYSPSEALAKEADEKNHDEEVAELRQALDEGYREAVEEARDKPPPVTVRAYKTVYGRLPKGWPPTT